MAMAYFKRKLNVPPPPGFSTVKNSATMISDYEKRKRSEIKYILENENDHSVDDCDIAECRICGVIVCQYNDPTHFSFHGCDRCTSRE